MKTYAMAICVCCAATVVRADEKPLELVALENARAGLHTGPVVWATRCVFTTLSYAPACGQRENLRRPEALLKFEESRARLATARIEWSRQRPLFRSGATLYYTSRLSPRECILHVRGDAQGVAVPGSEAKARRFHADGYQVIFSREGEIWNYKDQGLTAELHPARPGLVGAPDLRSLGASTSFERGDVHDTLWKESTPQAQARTYLERSEGGLRVVTADTQFGIRTWWIDPQRDWQVIRATLVKDGVIRAESRSSLRKFGNVWFPETVMFFRNSYKDGNEPHWTVTVYQASFNQPDQPAVLTPADIGIDVGMDVKRYDEQFRPTMGRWDGERVVSIEEYVRQFRAGEIQAGPRTKELWARRKALSSRGTDPDSASTGKPGARSVGASSTGGSTSAPVVQSLSLWEAYTLEFIARYQLDEGQKQSALRILKSCQQQAQGYLTKHKARMEELEKRVAGAGRAKLKPDKKVAAAREELQRLTQPVRDIFERQLKPRLDKLPTRAQRKAVADREPAPKTKREQPKKKP